MKSAVFNASFGPFDIVDGQQTVEVAVAGYPVQFLQISADTASGAHVVRYNEAAGAAAPKITDQEWEFDRRRAGDDRFDVWRVFVTPGADATTFTIQGHA